MAKKILFILCIYVLCFQMSTSDEEATKTDDTIVSTVLPSNDVDITTDEVVNTTHEMTLLDLEENMRKFLTGIYSRAFKYASSAQLPPKASFSCLLSLASLYFSFNSLKPWAFRMMDSSGKISGGLLEGTASELGDYDECIDIIVGKPHRRAPRGAYCLLEIKPPEIIINAIKEYQVNRGKGNISLAQSTSFFGFLRKVRTNPEHLMFRMGICMPSRCKVEDVQDLIDTVASNVDLDLNVNVKRCEFKKDYEYKVHEILIMVFLFNIIALTVVGTLVEVFCMRGGCINNSDLEPGPNTLKLANKWRLSKLLEILSNFSVCSSTQKLLDCKEEGDALDVIRGIKLLTVIFAIYTHTYALPHRLHFFRFRDTLNLAKFIDNVLFGTIANGSAGVDTLFFIAGFLFIYHRWRALKRPPIFTYILKFLGVSYVRMLAAQILVVFIFALFPIIGSGPLWHEFVEEPLENCINGWWYNVLFIQNFLGPYDSCLYHSWILATMMQLFLLTAMVVWIMHRKPVIGISTNIILIILGAVAVSIVTFAENFPATFTVYFYDYRISIQYFKYLYVQSYNHVGPFCIGMLVAYYIAENPPLKTKKSIVFSLWITAGATCCAIVFGLYHYRDQREMDKSLVIFYAALHRPAWALAIAWIVYACATDNGGFINSILSWKGLIPLERLCYLAYLIHIPIMYYHGGVQRERMFMGHYNQVMCFFSYVTASFLFSFVSYLLFQYPYQTIESYIFGKSKENIWQVEQMKKSSVSTETLKTQISIDPKTDEVSSRVLYSRYDLNLPISEVN